MSSKNSSGTGLRLLKKGQRGLAHCIFGRQGLISLLLLVQVVFMLLLFGWAEGYRPHYYGSSLIISLGMVLYLLNANLAPMTKITWLVIIIPLPIFGSLLFMFTQSELGQHTLKKRLEHLRRISEDVLPQNQGTMADFARDCPGGAAMAKYVAASGSYPVVRGEDVVYFPTGEEKFSRMLEELEKAESFIYLEYFIVDEGEMWGKILEILARKAAAGVDVRVMYDGTCEFSLLPKSYPKKLRKLGIQCKVFSPVMPLMSTHYNYRDHRKILVIDGKVAFNGGINLADEYINHIVRFGHWKDTAVMVTGDVARSFQLMFLQLWNLTEKDPQFPVEHAPVRPDAKGYVMPYADDPKDGEKVGKRVYMDLLNRAQRYVHIMTPYLILDNELESALTYAAKRGVDVALILPGIPDKKIPYALAKTHYRALVAAGVKIYEYTPGFIHAKVFVCDDYEAVVGTINLDYRSLYHHFECATYLCGVDCIGDIEADFASTVAKCRTVTAETIKKEKWYVKLMGYVMKPLAPLM